MDEKQDDATFKELREMLAMPVDGNQTASNECEWLVFLEKEEVLNISQEKLLFLTSKLKHESQLLIDWFNFLTDRLTDIVLDEVDVDFYMKQYLCLLPRIDIVEHNKKMLGIVDPLEISIGFNNKISSITPASQYTVKIKAQ